MNTQPQKPESIENQQSKSYQEIALAIDSFNNNLIKLIDSLNHINQQELSHLSSRLDGVSRNIAFINKYFEEVIIKKPR